MVDNREAFYSADVAMEAEAIMYLNYTQDFFKKRKRKCSQFASDFLEYVEFIVVNFWLSCDYASEKTLLACV